MTKYLSFLGIPLVWVFLSLLFFFLSPGLQHPLVFAKFHAFLSVYACFVWVMAFPENFNRAFFLGILAISAGIFTDFCLVKYLVDGNANHIPHFFALWLFLNLYLFFLAGVKKFLREISSFHLLLFLLFSVWALGNIFLLKFISHSLISFFLYSNPLVLTSLFFPNYDFIRGKFFYEVYPIASYLSIFRYPDISIAYILYLLFGIFLFFIKSIYVFLKKQVTK
ncbi:MAG: hypothetical protein HUU50_11620 [Candidatus Brocadiae bacterium]|nr:hypothetical protein [Candidatus Brocadiia bacterium]